MTIRDIYSLAVKFGIEADPRGKPEVRKALKRTERLYSRMEEDEKSIFDKERLTNPYDDTRILYGDPARKVGSCMIGIDIEVPEILLAHTFRQKSGKPDLLISHHPEGRALAGLHGVMAMQSEIFRRHGVPINVAEGLMEERIDEVRRKIMPLNHARAVDAARLLDIPFMCIHTPADNHVASFLQKKLDSSKPDTVGDVVDLIRHIPEYSASSSENVPPAVVSGNKRNRAGKVFVDMTGGTEAAKDIFVKLASAGVSTLVCMHLDEDRIKKVKQEHVNVVIAGHVASDNLGLNLLLDKLPKGALAEITECSGFRRMKRRQ